MCGLTELYQVRDCDKRPLEFKLCYETAAKKTRHTHPWMASRKNSEIHMLVEANSKPHDLVIFTDGSVTSGRSDWGFTVKQGEGPYTKTVMQAVTTSVLTMEAEAVTHSIQWLASQRETHITHAISLTDSMNLLQKVASGMGCPDWHTAMHCLRLQRLLSIFCPDHARVIGIELVKRTAKHSRHHNCSAGWQAKGA